jgi:hypothetical protein
LARKILFQVVPSIFDGTPWFQQGDCEAPRQAHPLMMKIVTQETKQKFIHNLPQNISLLWWNSVMRKEFLPKIRKIQSKDKNNWLFN